MSTQIPAGLVEAVKNRQAVLFAGAGVSLAAVGLGGLDIRDKIAAEIKKNYPTYDYTSRRIEEVCDDFAVLNDKQTLVNRIAGLIPKNIPATPAHIAAVGAFRFIVSANWDLLFEDAYRRINQDFQVLASEEDAPNFNFDQHNLLKIHGSADHPLTLVATSEDYDGYSDTHVRLLDRVGDLLYNNTVLFVGYSFRDDHIRRLLSHIRRQRGEWARRAYAVLTGVGDVRVKVLDSRKISVIPDDVQDFLPRLTTEAGF